MLDGKMFTITIIYENNLLKLRILLFNWLLATDGQVIIDYI